jgi:selenocysteine-specific elongation factor
MIVGTAGHIDHGKTSLVRALTGVDTDRLKEEKARGISIDLGFAYLPASDGSILGFVDVPGHERFVHNMLAGATGIDFVLLVIAADDGIMPQTIEHLAIVDLLGIEQGVVALTKVDLVDQGRREEVASHISRLTAGTRLGGMEVIPVSSATGEGLENLRARLFAATSTCRARAASARFRLGVDRCFVLAGSGTIVTGTVLSGTVSVGDKVIVSPRGTIARVRSIHAQNQPTLRSAAGERCALNLTGDGISKETVARGDMILDPELHAPTDRIDAELRLLASETKPIGQWTPARLHHAASDVAARIVLLGDEPVSPGREARIQLVLDRPIAAAAGDRFVLRDTSAQRTIGGGRFLDLRAPQRKRRTPARMAELDAHAIIDHPQALAALLDRPPHYVDLAIFGRDRAIPRAEIEALVGKLDIVCLAAPNGVAGLSQASWTKFKQSLLAALESFHAANPDLPGIGRERLRLQIEPRLPASVFLPALQSLAFARDVALEGAWVRLHGHEAKLSPQDEDVWYDIQRLLAGAERFRPPRVRDIAGMLSLAEPEVRRILKLQGRMGKLDEVAHDHFFLRATTAEIVAIIIDLAEDAPDGQFSAAQLRDRLDNGRKVSIQILEFLDRHGVTLRRGDVRRVNKHRLDLFGPAPGGASRETADQQGRDSSPVGRPDFKSGRGREPVFGGFDSHSLPPKPGPHASTGVQKARDRPIK